MHTDSKTHREKKLPGTWAQWPTLNVRPTLAKESRTFLNPLFGTVSSIDAVVEGPAA